MGINNTPNQNTALALDQKAITGVSKHFAKVKHLTLAGESFTTAELKAVFQAEIAAIQSLDVSRTQMKQLVTAARGASAKARATRKLLKAYVLGNYGVAAVQMLEDLGLSVPKSKGKATVKTKAQALVMAEATRKARHTMGKRQRSLIKVAPVQAPQALPPAKPAASVSTTPPLSN
jgi:hypothetical protein